MELHHDSERLFDQGYNDNNDITQFFYSGSLQGKRQITQLAHNVISTFI